MAQTNIITLQPGAGGVPVLAQTVYDLLAAAGHDPEVVYRATDEVPTSSRWAAFKYLLATPPVRHLTKEGMKAVAVTDYPVPPRYQYHLLRLARSSLAAPIAAVVSGSSHVGLPLALARRPYVLWVATLYEDELRGRAAAGDAWAEKFLRHRDWKILEAQEQIVYERAGVILALSPHTSRRLTERWPTLAQKLRTVVYPADTDRFQPAEGPAQPPYLLFTARIRDPRKNVNLLLRAFSRVRAEFRQIRLVIAGDDPLPATEKLAADFGLGAAITFAGHVPANDIVELYRRATLFVFPSLQEGLGISVLDAMACGVPVISTRCGGPEGLIEDNVTGVLVPNNDEEAMARAIGDLLRQPERMRAMGAAARERAAQQFSRPIVEVQLRAAFQDTFGELF